VNINIIAPHASIKLPLPPLADTLKQYRKANFGDQKEGRSRDEAKACATATYKSPPTLPSRCLHGFFHDGG
jgi:hypothetical protein